MKMSIVSSIIRIGLSITMLYYAYFETGLFTTIILSLILTESEGNNLLKSMERYKKRIDDEISNHLSDLLNKHK